MDQTAQAQDKVTRHRQRLRAAGLRPVQFWVADTREPAVAARLRAQCQQLQDDAAEEEAAAAARFGEAAAALIEGWR
jgi:hypothetical protein